MFRDRADAGRCLAAELGAVPEPTVLGLPRGGVPVAREVADALGAPLEVVVVRKLGAPRNPEYAMGALGEGGIRVVDDVIVARVGASRDELEAIEAAETAELARRVSFYRPGGVVPDLDGRTAVVVDDGLATGATARAACRVARAWGADSVVLAVPVAPRDAASRMRGDADRVVAVELPDAFFAVGQAYADFHQVGDAEVARALAGRVP